MSVLKKSEFFFSVIKKTQSVRVKFFVLSIIALLVTISFFSFLTSSNIGQKTFIPSVEEYYDELDIDTSEIGNCAGGIATGTAVKDGRSILWKNRHMSGENQKPTYYSKGGSVTDTVENSHTYDNYNFWLMSAMGMNEVGLSVGNFAEYTTLDNWDIVTEAPRFGQTSPIQKMILGSFDNVADAAWYAAKHTSGTTCLGIVSKEEGVGAFVSTGQGHSNITWVNNSWYGLSNRFVCDGEVDSKATDAEAVMQDSIDEHGYIDWRDIIQIGARHTRDGTNGDGTMYSCCITKSSCLSAIIAVSGDFRYNGAANTCWSFCGRQPLVGIALPIGASHLNSNSDFSPEWRTGGGIEDYVDSKREYALAEGSSDFYRDRVREIHDYTFQIENYSFDQYDFTYAMINDDMTESQVETIMANYYDTITPQMLDAYENEEYIVIDNNAPIVDDIHNYVIAEGESFTSINLDNHVEDVEDPDSMISWSASGNSDLIVSIVNQIANIAAPNSDWTGSETITFTATDTGGLSDSDASSFTITEINDPPVINNIIDQTIAKGDSFVPIVLDDYVTDVDNPDSEITWSTEGNSELIVTIIDHAASISAPNSDWTGSETITFTATDPDGLSDSDDAIFIITKNTIPQNVISNLRKEHLYLHNNELFKVSSLLETLDCDIFVIGSLAINVDIEESDEIEIDKVEFYIDDDLKSTSTAKICSMTINEQILGRHTIKVVVYDKQNNEIVREEMKLFIINLGIKSN